MGWEGTGGRQLRHPLTRDRKKVEKEEAGIMNSDPTVLGLLMAICRQGWPKR